MSWKLEGTYMETCNCAAACPCVFLSDPTEGDCGVLVGWHIARGRDGDVTLDGLNVALAAHSPGNMAKTKWKAAVYLDARADDAQREALTRIFGGQAGGHPAALASFIGEILGVAAVPIEFHSDATGAGMKVGDVGRAEIENVEGQGGGPVTVSGHPLAIAPGFPALLGRSKELAYRDHGMTWSDSGKTGFVSPFAYQG